MRGDCCESSDLGRNSLDLSPYDATLAQGIAAHGQVL